MCGIVGYVGQRPVRDVLLHGLGKLEYRGYDSAGISVQADGRLESVRAVGNLMNLRAALAQWLCWLDPPAPGSVTLAGPPTAESARRTLTRTTTRTIAFTSSSTGSSRTTSSSARSLASPARSTPRRPT